jgi:hypothetical protein
MVQIWKTWDLLALFQEQGKEDKGGELKYDIFDVL